MFRGCTSTQKTIILSTALLVLVPLVAVPGTVSAFSGNEISDNRTTNISGENQTSDDFDTTRTYTADVDKTIDTDDSAVDITTTVTNITQTPDSLDTVDQTTDSLDRTLDGVTDSVNRTTDSLLDDADNTINGNSTRLSEVQNRLAEALGWMDNRPHIDIDERVDGITDGVNVSDRLPDTVEKTPDSDDETTDEATDIVDDRDETDTDTTHETVPEKTGDSDNNSENTTTSTTPTPTPDETVRTVDRPNDSVVDPSTQRDENRVATTARDTGGTNETTRTDSRQRSSTTSSESSRNTENSTPRRTAQSMDDHANVTSVRPITTDTDTATAPIRTAIPSTRTVTSSIRTATLPSNTTPSSSNTTSSRPRTVTSTSIASDRPPYISNINDVSSSLSSNPDRQRDDESRHEQSGYLNVSSLWTPSGDTGIPFTPTPGTGIALGVTAIGVGAVVRHGNVVVGALDVSVSTTSTGILTTVRVHLYDRVIDPIARMFALFRYSRYDDSDPLEHEGRACVFEVIDETPGVYLSAVSEQTDRSLSTVRHHLRVLEQESLVMSVKVHGKRRFYPAYSEQVELTAALNDDATATVIDALSRLGPASVSDLADDLDRDPSTVTHHLQRLAGDGIVIRERDGRTVMNRLPPNVNALLMDATDEIEARVLPSSAD